MKFFSYLLGVRLKITKPVYIVGFRVKGCDHGKVVFKIKVLNARGWSDAIAKAELSKKQFPLSLTWSKVWKADELIVTIEQVRAGNEPPETL